MQNMVDMLYLLTKAYDQVAGKVFSDERIAFLQDLTYIADTQSSIAQKSKTLESMWRIPLIGKTSID